MADVLIVQGGWQGHQPKKVADLLAEALSGEGLEVAISETLDAFTDPVLLGQASLVVLLWTMGAIEVRQLTPLLEAVRTGTGFAALHGSNFTFHNHSEYQYMIGGQFVAHPGGDGVTYQVRISDARHPITEGIPQFSVTSEDYYMHTDPGNAVLAVTSIGGVEMPVAWTKTYGRGRVFYCSLGHTAEILRQEEVMILVTRGMKWAAAGKAAVGSLDAAALPS